VSEKVDWEGELALVISSPARNVAEADAADYIARYSIINDVTMRDYQYRTTQFLQGKTFENTAPFGPFLVTPEEFQLGARMTVSVDADVVQDTSTDDLIFGPEHMVSYLSEILTLNPGDVIATGTPTGIGNAAKPPRFLEEGSVLETAIEGLGAQRNVARR